jgi:cytidylate kinase
MRITVAGDIGSGKTTIARELARHAAAEMYSTGGIQRQLATTRGITTLDLNRLAETDPSIDDQIDSYLKNLPAGNLVVESRMAWRFVPGTKKIFLYVLKQAAAERILRANRQDETYQLLDDAMLQISERRKSEIKRFGKYYGVNIDDLRNYDRVIDTTYASPQAVVDRILKPDGLKEHPGIWLNPRNLVPTEAVRHVDQQKALETTRSVAESAFREDNPLGALYVDHTFFVAGDHARFAAAVRLNLDYVPLRLLACEGEPYRTGLTARRFVEQAVNETMVRQWESAMGFRYPHPIWRIQSTGLQVPAKSLC